MEGVIDLALFDRAAGTCFLLDWKTNRLGEDGMLAFRERYKPQLAAYWKAVSEMTGAVVTAALYSTDAGALLQYESAELAREWTRLASLPPQRMTALMTQM